MMNPQTIFHLTMLAFVAACIMGCGIAAAIELTAADRLARRLRRLRNKRRASFRARYHVQP